MKFFLKYVSNVKDLCRAAAYAAMVGSVALTFAACGRSHTGAYRGFSEKRLRLACQNASGGKTFLDFAEASRAEQGKDQNFKVATSVEAVDFKTIAVTDSNPFPELILTNPADWNGVITVQANNPAESFPPNHRDGLAVSMDCAKLTAIYRGPGLAPQADGSEGIMADMRIVSLGATEIVLAKDVGTGAKGTAAMPTHYQIKIKRAEKNPFRDPVLLEKNKQGEIQIAIEISGTNATAKRTLKIKQISSRNDFEIPVAPEILAQIEEAGSKVGSLSVTPSKDGKSATVKLSELRTRLDVPSIRSSARSPEKAPEKLPSAESKQPTIEGGTPQIQQPEQQPELTPVPGKVEQPTTTKPEEKGWWRRQWEKVFPPKSTEPKVESQSQKPAKGGPVYDKNGKEIQSGIPLDAQSEMGKAPPYEIPADAKSK